MKRRSLALVLIFLVFPLVVMLGQTRAAPPQPDSPPWVFASADGAIRFAAIGDYGSQNEGSVRVAAMVRSWEPDFIISLGDNNYPDGEARTIDANIGQYYHDYIYPYSGSYGPGAEMNRFFPSLGNHDWHTEDLQPYLDYFTLPGNERYYDFVWGPVHFFVLDSDSSEPDGRDVNSVQAAWFYPHAQASTTPWQIVYFHHPPYASIFRDDPPVNASRPEMRWPFAEWGIDAVLSGHNHLYERVMMDGFPYFTNGAGGDSLYDYGGGPPLPDSVRYNGDYGAQLITATACAITFEFYAASGGTGTLIDSYTIRQPCASIAGAVWHDANGDGAQNFASEAGIQEAAVTLTGAGPDGVFDTADDIAYAAQSTDMNGFYSFTGLGAGSYRVAVDETTLPAGYAPTAGGGTLEVTLTGDDERLRTNFGYQPATS